MLDEGTLHKIKIVKSTALKYHIKTLFKEKCVFTSAFAYYMVDTLINSTCVHINLCCPVRHF